MTTPIDFADFGMDILPESEQTEYIDEPPMVSVMDLTTSDSFHSPLLELENIALDKNKSNAERFEAFKRMYKSPYVNKNQRCIHILLCVLGDDTIPKDDRFNWLSQLKLSSDSLDVCLYGYIYWFYTYDIPQIYSLLSAQFIMTHPLSEYPFMNTHLKYAQQWLYRVAKRETEETQIRSEAADILLRLGTPNFRIAAGVIINQMGQNFIASKDRTLYTNTQNVHDIQNIEQAIKVLTNGVLLVTLDSILDWIKGLQHEKALLSFQRIAMDTGLFYGFRMTDLICYVFQRIQGSSFRVELEKRLVEEMSDMNGWCSSGHVIRLLNVLQGFDDTIQLTMPIQEEIKAAVFARFHTHLKLCSRELQEEIAMCFCQEDKTLLLEFMDTYSSYDELKKEYSFLKDQLFEESYQRAIRLYSGL